MPNQTGAGFPNNGFRSVPDVSLTGSANHDAYMLCVSPANCPGNWKTLGQGYGYLVMGGTSAGAQTFGGILTLINHYLVSKGYQSAAGLGSANPTLYSLASHSPSAFHDVTTGNNIVPCQAGTANCVTGSMGFVATSGYDQVTGLGSVDGYVLATAWGGVTAPQITSISPAAPGMSSDAQTVTVTGSGFQPGLTVTLTSPSGNNTTPAALSVTSTSFQISVVTNVAGKWNLQASVPEGHLSNTFSFTVGVQNVPSVTIAAPTGVSTAGATLNGTANPNGTSTSAWFAYGTSNTLNGSSSTTPSGIGSGSSAVAVSVAITGLSPRTTYYYQMMAGNTVGTSKSSIQTFTTGGATPPTITTAGALSVSNNSATLGATVNPNGADTVVWFGYSTNSSMSGATDTSQQDYGSGNDAASASVNISGLAGATTYYFQAFASNSGGVVNGQIMSFTTPGLTATLSGLSPANGATGVTTSPILTWNASPNATGYVVNFGLTNPPAASVTLSADKTTFAPGIYTGGQPFYWQVTATSSAASASSPVMQFSMGTLAMMGTKVGVFRNKVQVLEDTNGSGLYDSGADRFISSFSGPGGFITGDFPVAGDWTGDGKSKVGIYRSSTGTWYLDTNNNGVYDAGDATYQYGGLTGDMPVVGNWNNISGVSNYRDCIGIYRSIGSLWLLDLNCNGSYEGTPTDAFFPFGGLEGDVPVVGNWTGGTTRVGVVRKYAPAGVPIGEPFYWVLDSADANAGSAVSTHTPAPGSFAFGGLPGDVFITGDWNNTGAAKAGVFRAGSAGAQPFQWVLDANGRHTADLVFNLFGLAGDTAILGKW